MRSESFAKRFYWSAEWKRCRESYARDHWYLCERCLAAGLIEPGDEVHHRTPLTPDNLDDPAITLSPDNLMLLCLTCHDDMHRMLSGAETARWRVTADGTVCPA